ncbi:zf-HC2 domain-containing protein [Bacteroidota bacterium]
MDCKEVEYRIIEFIENTLPDIIDRDMKEHFEHCENCSKTYNEVAKTYDIIESDKMDGAYPFFADNVIDKIENVNKSKINGVLNPEIFSFVFSRIAITGIAAVIIFIVGLYILEGSLPFDFFSEPDYLAPENVTNLLLSNL